MGAKYTGVYLTQYQAGETLEQAVKSGFVVMNTDKVQYSQVGRTVKRHQTRTAKRRKMAKRLLWLILDKHYQIPKSSLTKEQADAVNSLLNRRGFTHLSEGVDEALLSQTSSSSFSQYFTAKIKDDINLFEAYQSITASVEEAKAFKLISEFNLTKQDFIKRLDDDYKENKVALGKAFDAFKAAIETFIKAEQNGQKIRSVYFENIRKDLCGHQDYQFLRDLFAGNIEGIANVIGHISNLQLRVLRRYFNDEAMKSGDTWHPQKLHKVFFRNVSAMHCKVGSIYKENQQTMFAHRPNTIIELFEVLAPERSIPPFENQNNRKPPKCQSLIVTHEVMRSHLTHWTAIVPKLVEEIQKSGIDITSGLDLSSINNQQQWAQALQRSLELNALHDPFQLRAWVGKNEYGEFVARSKTKLARVLNGSFDSFVNFAQAFYEETNESRSALWFTSPDSLLSVCNKKPRLKKNQSNELLSGAFSSEINDDKAKLLTVLWQENPKVGRKGIKWWCELAAKSQKEHGNALNYKIKRNLWLKETKKPVEDKELLELYENIEEIAENFAVKLDVPAKRFNNVFDLGKIFNLLKPDQGGFSKNCPTCTKENQWRSTIHHGTDLNGHERDGAFALRLPADTTRPFDGLLARLMDKQAYKIALAKIEQLPKERQPQGISIPIILEENRFSFSADLANIKNNKSKNEENTKRANQQKRKWLNKTGRIKDASNEICPYMGTPLADGGEIDHIIPRAETRRRSLGVLNHEANLIYCSTQGNRKKGCSIYNLDNLHVNYLDKQFKYLDEQFGSHDRKTIEKHIIAHCNDFLGKDIVGFESFNDDTQKIIRHGLFVDTLRPALMRLLHQSNKTKVNGSQAFFAKLIMQKIRQLYTHNYVTFNVAYIEAALVSHERTLLGDKHHEYQKSEPQPVASHMIDAAMVMAAALKQPHTREILQTAGLDNDDWRKNIIPSNVDVVRIEPKMKYEKALSSKSIFKEGLYAEHFIPLIVMEDKLGIGFNSKNVSWLLDKDAPQAWWQALSSYLNSAPNNLNQIQNALGKGFKAFSVNKNAAFELLEKVAKQSCSDNELLTADLLEALYYTTKKAKLQTVIYNETTKTYAKIEELTKGKKFEIKLKKIKSSYLNAKLTKSSKEGRGLLYPGIDNWKALTQMGFIQFNQGLKGPFDESGFNGLIQEVFPQTKTNLRQHKQVRKEWSLPQIQSVRGAYRARRKNADGSDIWQLFAIDGFGSKGFSHENGVINFSKDVVVPIPQLEKSGKLTTVGGRFISRELLEPFNTWREVDLNQHNGQEFESIYLSTHSKGGFRVAVNISYYKFNQFIAPMVEDNDNVNHWSKLPPELKLIKPKDWQDTFGKLLGNPRSNLFVINSGKHITLEYNAGSTNKIMQQAYQNGVLVKR